MIYLIISNISDISNIYRIYNSFALPNPLNPDHMLYTLPPYSVQQPSVPRPRKTAWYKANTEQKDEYTYLLEQKLATIPLPASLSSDSPCCRLEDHSINHDSHVMDIMCAILETSHQCIPLSAKSSPGGMRNRNLPGWNENVAPVKKDALFWHSVWMSAGRPNQGELYHVMCSTMQSGRLKGLQEIQFD